MKFLLNFRNLLTLFIFLSITACQQTNGNSDITVHSISSEDDERDFVGAINDPETGKEVFVIVTK